MFYPNKSSILVSDEVNSSRSKMNSFMRILNLQRIVFLMCIVSSGEITLGTKENEEDEIKVIKLGSEEEYDLNYKVVFLGDTKVGKTQIINQHVNELFSDKSDPTVGFEFMCKNYNRTTNENNKIIRLQIWDTPGQEIFRSISLSYIKNAQAIVLVYDVTNKDSFNKIKENWLDPAKDYNPDAVYFLVGNKTDLDEIAVTKEKAQGFAEKNKMHFFEVSAMKGDNVDKLFENIVKKFFIKDKDIKETISDDELEDNTNNDNESKVNKEATTPTTPTNNKRCSCCPCNKENKK